MEQKNATLLRAYLGQVRLDTPERTDALNALYDELWVYCNCFQPVLRLHEKARTETRIIRRWDTAQTPLERLLATGQVPDSSRQRLQQLPATINRRTLRQQNYPGLEQLLQRPVGRIACQEVI